MVSDYQPVCVCVCVSSCGYTGVNDAARPCGRGLGLVNPCPRLRAPLRPLWVVARAFLPPCPSQGPGLVGSSGQGWVWLCLLCGLPFWVGPAVTVGEGVSTLWAVAVRAHGIADSAPHCLKRMFAGAGYALSAVSTSSPWDFVFQSPLFGIRGDEERCVSALPAAVMGLGSAVSPQLGSLTHLLSLLPAEGEVRRRGSGTLPSGPASLKSRSKGSNGALWPLA